MDLVADVLKIWLPVLTGVGGGLWAFWLYIDHKREARRLDREQRQKEARTRLIEGQKPFLELQLRLYMETAQVAGQLVTFEWNSDQWKNSRQRFWALYWSELSMVESKDVETAMEQFGEALITYERMPDEVSQHALQIRAYHLAHAIRSSIESGWGAEIANISIIDGGKMFMAVGSPITERHSPDQKPLSSA
jgi:hypothetical protein